MYLVAFGFIVHCPDRILVIWLWEIFHVQFLVNENSFARVKIYVTAEFYVVKQNLVLELDQIALLADLVLGQDSKDHSGLEMS